MNNKILMLFVFGFILVSTVSAANWYVDNAVSSSGNGQSWNTAWKSFSNIAWNTVQPGDTIYISGGTTSKTYTDTLAVGKSGTSGNHIMITKGIDPGHTGTVIIDGNGASDVFDFGSNQYITLSNIRIENGDQLIRMRTSNVIVDNVDLFVTGSRGVDCRGFNNQILNSKIITDNLNNGNQKDGIWSTSGGNHVFSNNYMINRNPSPDAHSDHIQIYMETQTSIIANNFMWHDNSKTTNAQGIYIENTDAVGTYEIYNNVLLFPYAKNGVAIRNSQVDAKIFGNTFYQTNAVSANLWIMDDGANSVDNIIIKNNIFYTTSSQSQALQIREELGPGSEVSGNLFYAPNLANPIYYLNNAISLTTWNGYSFIGTDYVGNPRFINANNQDLKLQSESPAIDAGANLGSPYNLDKDGVTRPQGAGYDIGAYEYVSGGSSYHPADLNTDGCVSLGEISAYVGKWLNGEITLGTVSNGVSEWLGGC